MLNWTTLTRKPFQATPICCTKAKDDTIHTHPPLNAKGERPCNDLAK